MPILFNININVLDNSTFIANVIFVGTCIAFLTIPQAPDPNYSMSYMNYT